MHRYTLAIFREETFICTETLDGPGRFRRLNKRVESKTGFNSVAAHKEVEALLNTYEGDISVSVNEDTGDVKVSIGGEFVEGVISTL